LGYASSTTRDGEEIRQSVCEIVGRENVVSSSEVGAYTVDGKIPQVVVIPKSAENVSSLLALANKTGLSVIPRGSGTKMELGGTPKKVDMVLSLLNLNRITEYEPADLVVTAEAGLKLAELQKTLAKRDQQLPLDPPYTDAATLGGTVSANSSGPMRYRFGSCRDLLLGVKVVTASGEVVRCGGKVIKNVAGYDLKKLYVGALGTLGVITELTFRLYPLPASEQTFVASFKKIKNAAELVGRILGSELLPYAIEALNPSAFRTVAESAGVPLQEDSYVVVVGFGDVNEAVRKQLSTIGELSRFCGAVNGTVLDEPCTEAIWNAIRNLPRLMNQLGPGSVACKVSVPVSKCLDACEALERLSTETGITCAVSSDAGNGIVHFYPSAHQETKSIVYSAGMITKARDVVSEMGGTLIVERMPPELKEQVGVWGSTRSDFLLMQAIKSQLDPRGILSPGRFVGGI
jgi:glycolate oxidase FAD binding subunit